MRYFDESYEKVFETQVSHRPISPRILVVDNDPTVAHSLTLILEAHGFSVQTAYDAEQALCLAAQFLPHAVITEVILPGTNGVELARWFEKEQPACRFLLVSGHYMAVAVLDESKRRGCAHRFLTKPVPPTEILDFLADCLAA